MLNRRAFLAADKAFMLGEKGGDTSGPTLDCQPDRFCPPMLILDTIVTEDPVVTRLLPKAKRESYRDGTFRRRSYGPKHG